MKHLREEEVSLALSLGTDSSESGPAAKKARRRPVVATSGEGEFVCKTCSRAFTSFQALGGHRTSHLRGRHGLELGVGAKAMRQHKDKARQQHECHICGLGFEMGQALGGHMRRHREEMTADGWVWRSVALPEEVAGDAAADTPVFAMEGYMHILGADNLDGSEEIWDDPFIRPPEEQTCAVAQGSQPTGGNDEYSQHTKSSKKRTKNFTADEDEKLISAWLNVGLDPIESNNQSMSRYWQRMHAAFHEHKDFESDRSETSLMNRWSIINANVSRFCGVYAQVVRRKQSGLTEQDKIDHAKALYKNGHPKKQSFVMDHCWKKLRHEQKWIQRTDKSQNETTREQAPSGASPLNCSPGSNEQTPNEAMTRPPGKKQEKERQRRGKRPYGDGENHLKEVMSDFWINKKETEDLRELRKKERNDERLQLERERLELQRKDVEMKQRSEDERIINIDISTMSPDQQQFYKMLKDEIFTRRFGEPPVRGDTASI